MARRGKGRSVTGPLVLSETDVDSIRDRAVRGPIDLRGEPDAVTLGAALELACCWVTWRTAPSEAGVALLERWSKKFPVLRDARAALDGASLSVVNTFGAPEFELLAVRNGSDLVGTDGRLFLDRFSRSLNSHGFSPKDSRALAGALGEMADNILQHSAPTGAPPARGVIGYNVGDRWMSFAVADLGQGVLASLVANPRWASLNDDREALSHAVMHRATSRTEASYGDGFYDLHRALADMAGRLRFRSGEGVLLLDGRGAGARVATQRRTAFLPGFQLVVVCGLDSPPAHPPVPQMLT